MELGSKNMVRQTKSALSLLEVLIGMMVFSFGIMPLIMLFQSSHKQTAQAKNLMVAHSLGRTLISEVRSLGFDLLDREIDTSALGLAHSSREVKGPLVPSDSDSIEYPDDYVNFKTSLRLYRALPANNNKIRAEMSVEWDEPGRTFSLAFGTVVVKYGK